MATRRVRLTVEIDGKGEALTQDPIDEVRRLFDLIVGALERSGVDGSLFDSKGRACGRWELDIQEDGDVDDDEGGADAGGTADDPRRSSWLMRGFP